MHLTLALIFTGGMGEFELYCYAIRRLENQFQPG